MFSGLEIMQAKSTFSWKKWAALSSCVHVLSAALEESSLHRCDATRSPCRGTSSQDVKANSKKSWYRGNQESHYKNLSGHISDSALYHISHPSSNTKYHRTLFVF
ncbi:hypothetical protein ACLOJK_011009 [Asimina triloba]